MHIPSGTKLFELASCGEMMTPLLRQEWSIRASRQGVGRCNLYENVVHWLYTQTDEPMSGWSEA
jgi:hypothetical protein